MAFLRINGLDIDALVEGFEINDDSVEEYKRSASDSLEGLTFNVKKEIQFSTPHMTAADAFSLEGWVRGRQHNWDFQRVDTATVRFALSSKDAGISFTNGTQTATTLFGAYGLMIAAGTTGIARASATTSFGSEGDWTVHFYHRQAATGPYVSYGVVSRNGTITAWNDTASAASIFQCLISTSSGALGVALLGATAANTTNTANFCGVTIARYAFTTSMFLALASAYWGGSSYSFTRAPYITVAGDCLQSNARTFNGAGEKGPMFAKGFVEKTEVQPVILNGAFTASARKMTFRLTEK